MSEQLSIAAPSLSLASWLTEVWTISLLQLHQILFTSSLSLFPHGVKRSFLYGNVSLKAAERNSCEAKWSVLVMMTTEIQEEGGGWIRDYAGKFEKDKLGCVRRLKEDVRTSWNIHAKDGFNDLSDQVKV